MESKSQVLTDPVDANLQPQQGDCIEGMKQLPDESVQLVFADPPFNIGFEYDEYDDRLASDQYLSWSKDWISQVHRVLEPQGAFWLAIGDEYAAELKLLAQQIGFHTRSWVVWYYTFGVHCKTKFTRSHAHLFHFVKDPKHFVFNASEIAVPSARQLVYADKRANASGRVPDDTWILRPQDCVDGFTPDEDTWYFPRVAGTFKERAGFHGCQMPEQLLGRIIRSCSQSNDVVLDPFAGSCTTLAVAKKLGRRFLGFEMSTEYVKLGRQRIEAASKGDPLEGSPEPKTSVPATADGQRSSKGDQTRQRGFVNLTLDLPQFDHETDEILTAFAKINRGYSVDRVLADPILNEDFQTECDRRTISGTAAERNRFLFRIRTAGLLKQADVVTSRRTRFDWDQLDTFLYAAEIAWRRMTELYADSTLDEILCDPRLANMFDQIAQSWAPGFSPLEYRWAAIKIRKQASIARRHAKNSNAKKFADEEWASVGSLDFDSLNGQPGTYMITHGERELYAGETHDLAARLKLQLSESARAAWPSDVRTTDDLRIAIHKPSTITKTPLAAQSQLAKWYRPQWNFTSLWAR